MSKRSIRHRRARHGCILEALEERQLFSVIHEKFSIPFTANLGSFSVTQTASNLQATIDWGDGSTSKGTIVPGSATGGTLKQFVVDGTHTYNSVNTFRVVASVTEAGVTPTSPAVVVTRLHDTLIVARGNVNLRGTYKGVATPLVGNTLAGFTYSIPGGGNLSPMGAVTGIGTLSIPGKNSVNVNAVGILVLTTVSKSAATTGSVTLRLKGPKQSGGATPATLTYTITGGSGNYTGATGSGTIHLTLKGRAFQAVFVPLTAAV
jgi:hypothetical protein